LTPYILYRHIYEFLHIRPQVNSLIKYKKLEKNYLNVPFKNDYFKKAIDEINPEVDYKVKIVGLVVDKTDSSIVVDDGKSKAKVFLDPEWMERVSIHQLIAVFGSTIPSDGGIELKADAVQDLTGLNLNLYKKVEELYKKQGVYE